MSFDEIIEGFFSRDEAPTIEAFGGLDVLVRSAKELGRSVYADLFFDLVHPHRSECPTQVDGFIAEILTAVSRGPELSTMIDRMFGAILTDPAAEQRLFRHFLKTACDRQHDLPLRTASLKGALALLNNDSTRFARMVADIAETDTEDDPHYLSHAARVAGILLGRRHEPALLQFLKNVRHKEGCADQVQLELGLVDLRQAIDSDNVADVEIGLAAARQAFAVAVELRESRYDAKIYETAIGILLEFYRHREPSGIGARIREMRADAFAYADYGGAKSGDPLLGAIATQTLALIDLAQELEAMLNELQEDFWLEAANVIERQLIRAYSANQTILGGNSGHGVDCVIRPSLQPRLFGNHNHAAALRSWLRSRAEHMPADLVEELREAVSEYFDRGDQPNPSEAGNGGPLSPAQIERVRSTDPEGLALLPEVIDFYAKEVADGISLPVERALRRIESDFWDHEDYRIPAVRIVFLNLMLHTFSFLSYRLDSSVEQDKFAEYLFVKEPPLPVEAALQQDFLRHATAVRLPIDDEVKGVAGGRADLRYKPGRHEMIIEVKRELSDASFDNLLASYGDQTSIYQTTNVKLGVLLVLDLSEPHVRLRHLDTYYQTRRGDLLGDGTDRGVVIINVPGRRGTPAVATKIAKSSRSKQRRKGIESSSAN